MCKQLESFVYEWILDIIKEQLDPNQFGAPKGSSTVHTLLSMVNDWYQSTDDSRSGNIVRILLIDFAKAFDRINPYILIYKNYMIYLCLNSSSIGFYALLSCRKQQVNISFIHPRYVGQWPSGYPFTLLLFLIMINDLRTSLPTIKFVDDITSVCISSSWPTRLCYPH